MQALSLNRLNCLSFAPEDVYRTLADTFGNLRLLDNDSLDCDGELSETQIRRVYSATFDVLWYGQSHRITLGQNLWGFAFSPDDLMKPPGYDRACVLTRIATTVFYACLTDSIEDIAKRIVLSTTIFGYIYSGAPRYSDMGYGQGTLVKWKGDRITVTIGGESHMFSSKPVIESIWANFDSTPKQLTLF